MTGSVPSLRPLLSREILAILRRKGRCQVVHWFFLLQRMRSLKWMFYVSFTYLLFRTYARGTRLATSPLCPATISPSRSWTTRTLTGTFWTAKARLLIKCSPTGITSGWLWSWRWGEAFVFQVGTLLIGELSVRLKRDWFERFYETYALKS